MTMKNLTHVLALIGAGSQALLPIGVVYAWRMLTLTPHVDLDSTDMDKTLAGVKTMIQQLQETSDKAVVMLLGFFGFALLGLVLFGVALAFLRYRRAWAFWFACLYGSLLLLLFPVGTLFGVFLLVYALAHRSEFAGAGAGSLPGGAAGNGNAAAG